MNVAIVRTIHFTRKNLMFEVRLHGALWKRVTSTRAEEWRRALDELNQDNSITPVGDAIEEPAIELVRPPDGSYHIRIYQEGFDRVGSVELDRTSMESYFSDYSATISQMVHVDREAPVRGFEAIDYAKRVVHDEAAGFLRESLEGLVDIDLADARRFFTLVFLVGTDLPEALVRYHRRHGR